MAHLAAGVMTTRFDPRRARMAAEKETWRGVQSLEGAKCWHGSRRLRLSMVTKFLCGTAYVCKGIF